MVLSIRDACFCDWVHGYHGGHDNTVLILAVNFYCLAEVVGEDRIALFEYEVLAVFLLVDEVVEGVDLDVRAERDVVGGRLGSREGQQCQEYPKEFALH